MAGKMRRKMLNMDENSMDDLEYLAWLTQYKKAHFVRRILKNLRKLGNDFMKGTELSIRIVEPNSVVFEFFGDSRNEFKVEEVEKGKDENPVEVKVVV
jgi:hypothetical protein